MNAAKLAVCCNAAQWLHLSVVDAKLSWLVLYVCYSVCRMISHLLVDKVCQCYSKLKLWLDTLRPSAATLVGLNVYNCSVAVRGIT